MRNILLLTVCLAMSGCMANARTLSQPIAHTEERSTPLYFGLHVTPDAATNPIQPPERFEGYHVGTDFEITKDELNIDVPISAVCNGKILYAGFAEGYGGVITEKCTLKQKTVTVIYGHLNLASLVSKGSTVKAGDKIAILAPARSHDSDGNRKHLHFGISLGTGNGMRGYVQTEAELKEFMDAQQFWPSMTETHTDPSLLQPYWETASGANAQQ